MHLGYSYDKDACWGRWFATHAPPDTTEPLTDGEPVFASDTNILEEGSHEWQEWEESKQTWKVLGHFDTCIISK